MSAINPIAIVSLQFFVFVVIALFVYYAIPEKYKNIWLLLLSYAFYVTWGLGYLLTIIIFTLANYFLARGIERTHSKILFQIAILINGLSFILLKALVGPYGFSLLGRVFDQVVAAELTAILLPVGFSFYVLESISYLVDVYREQISAEQDLLVLALYFAYFPKMLAGPIERARTFIPSIKAAKLITPQRVEEGIYLILLGLLRKVAISDRLLLFLPKDVFSTAENYVFPERVLWLFIFAFILYNDFAGYSSLVRGVSLLFGIDLKVNFKAPMFARSFSEFWTRWHISLSEWLRDYIFFPTRRWFSARHAPLWLGFWIAPLATMLVSGYWHGAYLSMIGWGFIHGIYLVFEQGLQRARLFPRTGIAARVYGFFVFLAVTFAWIFFCVPGLGAVKSYLFSSALQTSWTAPAFYFPDLLLLPLFSVWLDSREEKLKDLAFLRKWTPIQQAVGVAGILTLLLLLSSAGANLSGFVYQGF